MGQVLNNPIVGTQRFSTNQFGWSAKRYIIRLYEFINMDDTQTTLAPDLIVHDTIRVSDWIKLIKSGSNDFGIKSESIPLSGILALSDEIHITDWIRLHLE